MRDDAAQVFEQESERVVKRHLAFADHQTVNRFVGFGEIDAKLGCRDVVAGIIKVTCAVVCLLIVRILLQRIDERLRQLRRAENRIPELSVSELFGGDDREIHSYDHHRVGDDAVRQVNQVLDGGIHKP